MQEEFPQLETETGYQEAAAIIMIRFIDNKPHILLAQRLKGEDAGKYTLPGGTLQTADEDPQLCVIRELKEETGLITQVEFLIDSHPGPFPVRSGKGLFLVTCYLCYWDESTGGIEPKNNEPTNQIDWKWTPLIEAINLAFEGKLPLKVFEGWWIELVNEIQQTKSPAGNRPAPAYFLRPDNYISQP
jgi:8-oxo-dGTP pyrophosphatase MutT (NUDIX family)